MTDYSQCGEQAAILEACKGSGTLLDIGAWHATVFSNSRALIEAGWSAVLIEPSPEPMASLVKEYGTNPKITLLSAAVGFEAACVKLHITADAVSTSVESVHEQWKDAGGYYGDLWVPQITLESISNQFGGFAFVNIDAEGISVDLAKRMLEIKWRPHCFCVEHDSRIVEVSEPANAAGYRAVLTNGTNIVFSL